LPDPFGALGLHHAAVPVQRPPGTSIGPAAPSVGGAPAPEAAAQAVGRGWCGEIRRPMFDPLLTQKNVTTFKTTTPQAI